jgi:hypothetical protein
MRDIERRLSRLEDAERPGPDGERRREEERKRIRGQAEHANYCGWGEEGGRWPLFEIDEDCGDVFCTYDEKPVTDSRQILAEIFLLDGGCMGSNCPRPRRGGPGVLHAERRPCTLARVREPTAPAGPGGGGRSY